MFNIFKKLFGNNENSENIKHSDEDTDLEAHFEKEFRTAFNRYFLIPGAQANFKIYGEDGEELDLISSQREAFEEWKKVEFISDRKSIIYKMVLDDLFYDQIPLYKKAERFIDDRYAPQAIELLEAEGEPEEDKAEYWTSYSKALSVLGDTTKAVEYSRKAVELDSQNKRALIQLADVLHIEGQKYGQNHEYLDEAHDIYHNVMEKEFKERGYDKNEVELSIVDLLSFEGDILNSPVYAVSIIQSSEDQVDELWSILETDFYWSPYFRTAYAYYLNDHVDNLRAFAKLYTLIKEMPWLKEVAINTMQFFQVLDPEGNTIFPEDRVWLEKLIKENNWTTDGMYHKDVPLDLNDE